MRRFKRRSCFLVFFHFLLIIFIGLLFHSPYSVSFWIQLLVTDFLIIFGIYAFNGYEILAKKYRHYLISNVCGAFLGILVSLLFTFFFTESLSFSFYILLFLFTAFVLSYVTKLFSLRCLHCMSTKKVLILGNKIELQPLLKEIEGTTCNKIQYCYCNDFLIDELTKEKSRNQYDEIIVADYQLTNKISIEHRVFDDDNVPPIIILPDYIEETICRIPIQVYELFHDYYQYEFANVKISFTKRVFDIIASTLAIVLLSPLFVLISIAIVCEDRRNPFFVQERIGFNNEPFNILKFRTMTHNPEKACRGKYVIEEKHRITFIGKLIRPIRLDEILQFINILKGDMSLIGPRPEQTDLVGHITDTIPFYPMRHKLRPGITGWAQTQNGYASTIDENKIKLSYDLFYVKNWSLILDFKIVLKTIKVVLFKKGAL